MPAILSSQSSETSNLVLRHLAAGECVALPTEANYEIVASALQPTAATRLRTFGQPTLVITEYAELIDWLPLVCGSAVRLFRKMGAGPVALEADAGHVVGLWRHLPTAVQQLTAPHGRITVRWPNHTIWSELRQANVPLISTPIPNAHTAEDVPRLVGEQVACVVDGGRAMFIKPPTMVRADGRRLAIQQSGAVPADQIDELALSRIVFICTGNTCRSPMAQALCIKLLSDAVGCAPGDLRQHGYSVESAGLAAMAGQEAAPDGVRVVSEMGADLGKHSSRMVTLDMLERADYIFGMTAGHCWTLESVPATMPVPRMLSPNSAEIADPIGGAWADYKTCAHEIFECLRQRLPELLES